MTCRQRWTLSALVALAATASAGGCLATGDLVQVAEYAWTNRVDDGAYAEVYQDTAPLGPLYLWTRLHAEAPALETLRHEGKLPIRHKWFKCVGSRLVYEITTTPVDAIDLAVGDPRQLELLASELHGRGFFDWRTWSMKEHLRRGLWVVRLVYADDSAVKCNGSDERCEFAIDVE